jgi:hypothetical protein
MKPLLAACLLALGASAASAAEASPVLRVYIDTPYFYDILIATDDATDPRAMALTLSVEGKEVGGSTVVYDCKSGDYAETVTQDWTGNAARYVPTALMAYADLHC